MTKLKAEIEKELNGLSFEKSAAEIKNIYKKQLNKKIAAFTSSTISLTVIALILLSFRPPIFSDFMNSFSSAFSKNSGDSQSPKSLSTTFFETTVPETKHTNSKVQTTESDKKERLKPTPSTAKSIFYPNTAVTEAKSVHTDPADIKTASETVKQNTNGNIFKYTVRNDNTAAITGINRFKSKIRIPSEIKGHTVTAIGSFAFKDSKIVEAKLPDTIKIIDSCAFQGAKCLTKINLPSSLKIIGYYAFEECKSLKNIRLKNVTEINSMAFFGCKSLTEITIPHSVKNMGTKTFADCESLKKVTLKGEYNSGSSSPDNAGTFENCTSLKALNVGEGVETIPQKSFLDCTSLKSVKLPSTLIKIGDNAFKNCSSLTEINIPASVKSIGYKSFFSCLNLTKVTISGKRTQLNDYCLGFCEDKYGKPTKNNILFIYCLSKSNASLYGEKNGFITVCKNTKTTITLKEASIKLNIHETYKIEFEIKKPYGETLYKSLNNDIASVNKNGVIQANKTGTTKITVANNGAIAQLTVNVVN